MKPQYLIDTDWAIDHLKGIREVSQKLEEYEDRGLSVSIISVAELYEGVYYSNNPTQNQQSLEEFLSTVQIIMIDEEIGKIFARERGRLRQAGNLIGDLDLLIAATALYYNMTLLTNNTRHFGRITGLSIESIPKETT